MITQKCERLPFFQSKKNLISNVIQKFNRKKMIVIIEY